MSLRLASSFLACAIFASAATSTAWQVSGFTDFLKGRLSGLSLTADGRRVVDAAAAAFKSGKSSVAIAGYTDLAGTQQYNLALSKRRADAVKAALVSDGDLAKVLRMIPYQ